MKRLVFFFLHSSLFILCASAQLPMRDIFAAMPDSVLPMVSKNNRLDCIDFIENGMEARVRNKVDEYVTLEALTADYARFRTSASAFMELKLLPEAADSTFVLCMVTTAVSGEPQSALYMEDSNIHFLKPDWSPLSESETATSVPSRFNLPEEDSRLLSLFLASLPPDSLVADYEEAFRSLTAFHPLKMQLSPDEPTLTLFLQTGQLANSERKAVESFLRPVVLRWKDRQFMVE